MKKNTTPNGETGPKPETSYRWKPWKIAAMSFAGLLMVTGAVAAIAGSGDDAVVDSNIEVGPAPGVPVKGFGETAPAVKGGITIPDGEKEDPRSALSPALFRGGFSFFIAFCAAFALRAFLRIGAIFVGIWALSLFVFSYVGWMEVHWTVIDRQFVDWTQNLGDQFASFQDFITGSLPSTGMAGLGLFTGFRKK